MSEYIGKHRPTGFVEIAEAYVTSFLRDSDARKHGYDYTPRHSRFFGPAWFVVGDRGLFKGGLR